MSRAKGKAVVEELLAIIDYLAPPRAEPGRRARVGFESGRVPGRPGAWDGGKQWAKTDARIERAVKRAREMLLRPAAPKRKPRKSRGK